MKNKKWKNSEINRSYAMDKFKKVTRVFFTLAIHWTI